MNEVVQVFLRQPGVLQRNMGAETILYTDQMDAVHVLNRTARLIWSLCDGNHTLADLEQAVRAKFAVREQYDLLPDIRQALAILLEKGLIVAVDRTG